MDQSNIQRSQEKVEGKQQGIPASLLKRFPTKWTEKQSRHREGATQSQKSYPIYFQGQNCVAVALDMVLRARQILAGMKALINRGCEPVEKM